MRGPTGYPTMVAARTWTAAVRAATDVAGEARGDATTHLAYPSCWVPTRASSF